MLLFSPYSRKPTDLNCLRLRARVGLFLKASEYEMGEGEAIVDCAALELSG